MDLSSAIKGDWLWLQVVRQITDIDPSLNFIRMVKPSIGEKYLMYYEKLYFTTFHCISRICEARLSISGL